MEEKNSEKKEEVTMDDLARIVQEGFLDMEGRFKKIETDVKGVKSDTEYIKAELNKKVDIFTHNDLKYRVEKVEKKFA
ncbi:MAG: hypothetical protein WC858_00195 [Parcubacteria group bacterium]|jgi:hypothetical protein